MSRNPDEMLLARITEAFKEGFKHFVNEPDGKTRLLEHPREVIAALEQGLNVVQAPPPRSIDNLPDHMCILDNGCLWRPHGKYSI